MKKLEKHATTFVDLFGSPTDDDLLTKKNPYINAFQMHFKCIYTTFILD